MKHIKKFEDLNYRQSPLDREFKLSSNTSDLTIDGLLSELNFRQSSLAQFVKDTKGREKLSPEIEAIAEKDLVELGYNEKDIDTLLVALPSIFKRYHAPNENDFWDFLVGNSEAEKQEPIIGKPLVTKFKTLGLKPSDKPLVTKFKTLGLKPSDSDLVQYHKDMKKYDL